MKRVLLTICSICLVLACLFGLFAVVGGMKDVMAIQEYKTEQGNAGREGIAAARDGIAQLKENEDAYNEGVSTYNAGKLTLAQGYKDYNAGKQTLAEGQATIDANTDAYNEGKELLGKIEPLMPYVSAYQEARHNVYDFEMGLPIVGDITDARYNMRASVVNLVAASSSVSWISEQLGMDLGSVLVTNYTDDQMISLADNIVTLYNDGMAQIKAYEDGLVALEEGKKALADAEVQLANGEKQLADGDAQLSVFEDGQSQLAAGMYQLLEAMTAVDNERTGVHQADSLEQRLGEDFSIWVLNDDGTVKEVRGCQYLDLDACSKLCDEAEAYLDLQEEQIAAELYGRIGLYVALAIACVFGIVSGICGIVAGISGSKKTGLVGGIICAVLAVGTLVAGFIMGFQHYTYPLEDGSYTGDLQYAAIIVLAVVAVLFVVFAALAKSAAKQKEAKLQAEATQAAAAGAAAAAVAAAAPAVDTEKVAELEAENAALKEMVSKLAAEAATVQE